ncbi:hypothetical protein WN984_26015 [Streptomyces noursei]
MAVLGDFTGNFAPYTEPSAELRSSEDVLARDRLYQAMNKRGLLRNGISNPVYTMNASMLGFLIRDRCDTAGAELASGRKADSSAHLVKQSPLRPRRSPRPAPRGWLRRRSARYSRIYFRASTSGSIPMI